MNPAYNTSVIRRLLLAAFTDEEFTFFCYDHFREVYQKFAGGMTFTAKTQLLIEQCENRNEFGKLLPLVEGSNPAKYTEFTDLIQKPTPQSVIGTPLEAHKIEAISNLQSLSSRQPFEPEMILIPAGEFLMGSDPLVDKYAQDNEQPQHRLYLPDYYLSKTPVTNAQYLALCGQPIIVPSPSNRDGVGVGQIKVRLKKSKEQTGSIPMAHKAT
ncbi:MAG: SUMF1/EgtB/PvdO family nonheme iron enzyme [Anaerolineales bacterium]|nr:SUMF1/EgtB/PvdO family nonheme iron enzyme [Anaerolineales bacterium]